MKKKIVNPFVCHGYESPKYFCDREEETKTMISALRNERNITLVSPRRLGITSLIKHVFNQIQAEERSALCLYIDIFPTKSQAELASMLGAAVIDNAFSKGKAFGKKMLGILGSLRPVVSNSGSSGYDPTLRQIKKKSYFCWQLKNIKGNI